jgi:hypothetical protein
MAISKAERINRLEKVIFNQSWQLVIDRQRLREAIRLLERIKDGEVLNREQLTDYLEVLEYDYAKATQSGTSDVLCN